MRNELEPLKGIWATIARFSQSYFAFTLEPKSLRRVGLSSVGVVLGGLSSSFQTLCLYIGEPSANHVTEVVKLLCGVVDLEVDMICSEYLKAVHIVGQSWLMHLCNISWSSRAVPMERKSGMVVPLFKTIMDKISRHSWGVKCFEFVGERISTLHFADDVMKHHPNVTSWLHDFLSCTDVCAN